MTSSIALRDQKTLHTLREALTPKEQLYCDARAQGMPPYAAARSAGYEDPTAAFMQLENNQLVRSTVEYLIRVQAHRINFTREDVLQGFKDAIDTAVTSAEKIAGWREIGKIVDAYAPIRVETTSAKDKLAKMSDEELAKAAAIDAEDFEVISFTDEPSDNQQGS